MNKIIVLRGLPASGKSTYAKAWVKEDPAHRTRWNRDSLREMSCASFSYALESIMHDLMDPYLEGALIEGYDIILDDTNLGEGALYRIKDFIENYEKSFPGHPITLERKDFFGVSLQECLSRNLSRGLPLSQESVEGIYRKYESTIDGTKDPWDLIIGNWYRRTHEGMGIL